MRKYMWPNSCLPSATALITACNSGSQGRFTLEGVENHAARKSTITVSASNSLLTFVIIRLSTHTSRVGKAPWGQLVQRPHRTRLPSTERSSRLQRVQAQVAIPFRLRWRWFRSGLHHLPHAYLHSRGTYSSFCLRKSFSLTVTCRMTPLWNVIENLFAHHPCHLFS